MKILLVALCLIAVPAPAHGAGMDCTVSTPISAVELNAGVTWSFEVSGARPDTEYFVKVNWPGDPSNNAHANAGIATDFTGHGVTTLGRYWAPDGTLPGYFAFWDPFDPASGFVAIPGSFSVQVGPKTIDGTAAGKATCQGEVLP